MPAQRIVHLVQLYFSNTISEIQKEELSGWIVQSNDNDEIRVLLEEVWKSYQPDTPMPAMLSAEILAALFKEETINEQIAVPAPVVSMSYKNRWWRMSVAAAVLAIFVCGAYLWLRPFEETAIVTNNPPRQQQDIQDAKPGGQKAILTLSDGTQIIVDSASNGLLAQQGNVEVIKLSTGGISYKKNSTNAEGIFYNTMSTPAGGLYQLRLPDGSKVWLNASSSIRYPTQFDGKERRVQINGEAYFEVSRNTEKPFIVKVNDDAEVIVLGTHFNINAYLNEGTIKTTLLEGAVKVRLGNSNSLLKPGQQAQIKKGGSLKRVDDADTEEAIAWKNGNFQFNSTPLEAVLRQAARWYNLEVEYKGAVPDDRFTGKISRSVNLSNLLKWMKWSDVHFKIEGNKLIVMP